MRKKLRPLSKLHRFQLASSQRLMSSATTKDIVFEEVEVRSLAAQRKASHSESANLTCPSKTKQKMTAENNNKPTKQTNPTQPNPTRPNPEIQHKQSTASVSSGTRCQNPINLLSQDDVSVTGPEPGSSEWVLFVTFSRVKTWPLCGESKCHLEEAGQE